jgi:hypothetical protein
MAEPVAIASDTGLKDAQTTGSRNTAGRMKVAALCGDSPPWRLQPIASLSRKRGGLNKKGKNSL